MGRAADGSAGNPRPVRLDRVSGFADRLIAEIRAKGNPCVVGLDPRIELMPDFVTANADNARQAIASFHDRVVGAVAPHVPAVKLQSAFYEQYGLDGIGAFVDTIRMAKDAGLVVIVDAKRNDIASTATAYANAFLGTSRALGREMPVFDVDCITVSPFLGRDSLAPFVEVAAANGKGLFVLVKTSNPGSADIQDLKVNSTGTISMRLARLVDDLGASLVGESGYSSIGAVVGATFPEEASTLRRLMPRAIILVPGYGSQGAAAGEAVASFNDDGLGAVVNASRSITYELQSTAIPARDYDDLVLARVTDMVAAMKAAVAERSGERA